ncbi:MAG: 5'-nucleotidase C-terminal domain-containing protein [Crocosphaera sp.]
MFRINPYLQQPSSDGTDITWFTEENISSEVSITGPGLNVPLTFTINPTFETVLSYTDAELNQEINGLESGSWLLGNENYKHTVDIRDLLPDSTYEYSVTVGDDTFESRFETAPTAEDWDEIRFVVFSDSETEPRGRVNRRDWQQGALEEDSLPRPDTENSLWAETFGVRGDRLNYPLTENVGYRNNLEIINSREPDFMMMPGDLIQGGGYQPAWDEFFRHNAGEFDSGLSEYPILPALGNWENFGALNGGYGIDPDGRYGPLFGRQKYDVYFDAPDNGTPEHQDNYYRIDYGPITILTLDSSNGEPDDNRNNYGGEGQPPKIGGQAYTGPGTDTQENITREQYEAAGGTDLADFNPGSPQWNWVREQLESAREQGQIVFAQFHHAPYSNGTHGLPMNHEDSSGQGGTPMRQYHPLFEEYGVVAVFSGHSEMFERSFVDEDNDGEGVYYYDVGVAGDGMRGQRTDAEGNLLGYNQFSQWTADQDEPELWQEVDGVLQNVAGGKHYGHLEVNLKNLAEEDQTQITFTPVYSFPLLDGNYNLIDTERRVYGDEIVIEVDNRSTEPFTLQILHTSDQEAGTAALQDAIGLSAVMNALEDDYDNTLKLTSGDLFIPGPFFNASRNVYGEQGIADILIQNELEWDAAAVGNHEFDAGPRTFATLIAPDADIQGVGIDPNTGYAGTAFPYLATNLDYSTDSSDLKDFVVPDGEAPTPNSLAGSVVMEVGGERIGVVGAVTPILPQISIIGGITMLTDSTVTTIEDQAQTIADNVQPAIDELVAQGINKIVLMTHLQQFEIEQALAGKLSNVDVLMGGGNHRVMANDDDILREDEIQTSPQVLEPYPQVFQDADNNPIYLINTAANYRYLGQLVLEFDGDGVITSIGDESGTFATDIAGVDRLYDEDITTFDQVKAVADPEILDIVDNLGGFINSQDGNIAGNTAVYLNGVRGSVRTEETNLGNLTADANLWYARQYGLDVDISVKNGGGIRDHIGVSFIEGGTNELIQLPPQANPEVGKAEGDVSQLDISNALRFDNKLSVVDISAQGIKDLAEHLVAASQPGVTPGQFGQVGGFSFSYDPDNTAIVFERDVDGDAIGVEVAGDRIRNLVLDKPDGTQTVIVKDGELQVSPEQTYKMVILDFLANGGDGYPIFHFQNITTLDGVEAASLPDNVPDLVFAGEQDALAEYLAEFHPTAAEAFNEADTPIEEDTRIQNLNFRNDTVIEPPEVPMMVRGTAGDDEFDTEDPGDGGFIGDNQLLFAGSGADFVDVSLSPGGPRSRIDLGSGDDIIFAGSNNRIIAGSGDDMLFLSYGEGDNVVTGGSGMDQFWLTTDDIDLPTNANTITDFTIGEDVIGFGATALSYDDLMLTQNGFDTTINALGQDLAILRRVNAGDLSASDFVFG